MRLIIKDTYDLWCDMEDGTKAFKMGWVQNTNYTKFYCMCSWMTDVKNESYQRPWLQQTTYPETHIFDTEHEAMQALIDSAMVAIIGGFRGRSTPT